MTSANRIGRLVGILLLVQLATGLIVPYIVLLPLTTPPAGFLQTAAGMAAQVRLNVLLLFVGGAASVGISLAAWPLVRERGYRLGLCLLALTVTNFILQIIENSHWLTMLSVSQAYAETDAASAVPFQSLGIAVRATWKWAHYSHILVVVGWLFTFYCVLLRCALVPRALAALGMVASLLQISGITLPAFAEYRMPLPELFGIPLALAIVALAVWMIVKGLNDPVAGPLEASKK